MEIDLTRPVTHENYKRAERLKKYYHRVEKKINVFPNKLNGNKNDKWRKDKSAFIKAWYIDNNFIDIPRKGSFVPLLYGGVSFLVSLIFIIGFFLEGNLTKPFEIFLFILASLTTVFFIIYYFTKPKKEQILNRRDGLITMTGFYWQKNITMPFKECLFAYSTGGEDGTGSFMLEAIRPAKSKFNTLVDFNMGQGDCYKSMSFICWYMDKNRPLPPGDAFDAYRQQDYERRKAEGFPKPLYPSAIKTPEATKEQQKEREAIGGW